MQRVDIGNAVLILGDCRETIGCEQFDAIVTDPPYGIGFVHSGGGGIFSNGERKSTRFGGVKVHGDDEPFDPSHLTATGVPMCLWGAIHFADRLPIKPGHRWLCWDKGFARTPGKHFSHFEAAWTNRKAACRLKKWVWDGCFRQEEGNREPRVHPTQKPIGIMRWSIDQLGVSGRIADPYMGSGTTGVACAQLGLPFIGWEIDRQHFETACQRIKAAQHQTALPLVGFSD